MGGAWVSTRDASLVPLRITLASAGGEGVGTLHIARDVMERICSHIGTSVERLHIVVRGKVFACLADCERRS